MALDRKNLSALQKDYNENLAKELGYTSFKDLKSNLNRDNYSGSLKSRLEQGAGIGESVIGSTKEGFRDIKRSLDPKKLAKDAYLSVFSGDDILSSYMRGRLKSKKRNIPEPTVNNEDVKQEFIETLDKKLVGRDKSGRFTKLSDKEQLEKQRQYGLTKLTPTSVGNGQNGTFGSNIVGDVETIRKSVSILLKFEKESQEQKERQKQGEFFAQQDAKEADLESARVSPEPIITTVAPSQGENNNDSGGTKGLLSKAIGNIIIGLKNGFKFLFNPSKLLKVLGKVFIIATIVTSLFKGILAGFDRWKETGSISEAIIAGIGAIVDFLSFGLLGEDTIRGVFDTVGGWISKLKDTIVDTLYKVKDWIVNNVGIPQFSLPMWAVAPPIALINKGAELIGKEAPFPKEVTIGPFYPFKDIKTSSVPEYSKRPQNQEDAKVEELLNSVGVSVPTDMPKLKDLDDMIDSRVENLGMQVKNVIPQQSENSPTQISDMISGDQAGGMFSGLESLVQQYGGDEAVASMKKDQANLQSFNEQGGIASKFGEMSQASSGVGTSLNIASQTIADKIKSGGIATGPTTPNLGQQLGENSSDVESGQRMESVPDLGNIFNTPNITNNTGSSGKKKLPPADVFNSDFANVLMRT